MGISPRHIRRSPIAALAHQNKKTLYDILFRTSADTLAKKLISPRK
ncbi:hypothetical protein [Cupriavidus necator]